MDEPVKIYLFQNQADAQAGLTALNQAICNYWAGQGYTIIDCQVVPKDFRGVDDLTATRTKTWDELVPAPDGSGNYYFGSICDHPIYSTAIAVPDVSSYQEMDLPDGWDDPHAYSSAFSKGFS